MKKLSGGRILMYMVLPGCLLFHSCYYDSEEYLFPEINSTCDTMNVTYINTIQPMLQSYCYSCHSNSSAAVNGGGVPLEDYSDVKVVADDGKLYGSIAHLNGYNPMPKGGSKLSECQITQTDIWIKNGASNN